MKHDWLFMVCLVVSTPCVVSAQGNKPLEDQKVPLQRLLNEDGTLNLKSGFSGSLDHMLAVPLSQNKRARCSPLFIAIISAPRYVRLPSTHLAFSISLWRRT